MNTERNPLDSIIPLVDKTKAWVLIVGVIIILALTGAGLILTIRSIANSAVRPVQDLSGSLGTEIADILHPTPTILPDPITIIHDVRSLARLESVQYSIEKVISAGVDRGSLDFLFGDQLLFVAHGDVIAGLDLSRLTTDDIWTKDGVLYMRLPEPEIFIAALDNDKSYVFNRDTGLLTKGDINLETSARQVAEDEIERAALEDGILDQARLNAENYLVRLMRGLGYPEVIFSYPEPTPDLG
jgi:Protein of unknown function (DUF4230)